MNKMYQEVLKKHKVMLTDLEEAIILHHIGKMTFQTISKTQKIDQCLDYWCHKYSVEKYDVKSKSRKREVAEVRMIVTWIVRNDILGFRWSFASIGQVFGRDHSTAIHYCRIVNDLITFDGHFRDNIMEYLKEIGYVPKWNWETKELTWDKPIDLESTVLEQNHEINENAVFFPSEELS